MSPIDDLILAALCSLPQKPLSDAKQAQKKGYSERMSAVLAAALAEELRNRGLAEARPGGDGELGKSGAERRMSGGIGAKKVDVTWATQESGLLLGLSVKCINFVDGKTKNFQKNLVNRRGDMLFEAVTLHRRFPYAVLGGFLFFDKGAESDGSILRESTFANAHQRLKLFTGRRDPAGRDEQYEELFISLVDATPFKSSARIFAAGDSAKEITFDIAFDQLLRRVAERDSDFYVAVGPSGEVDDETTSPVSLRLRKSGRTRARQPVDGDVSDADDADDEPVIDE